MTSFDRFNSQRLKGSPTCPTQVDEAASVAALEKTVATFRLVGESTFAGQQECPAGTFSLSGETVCVYCDLGAYTDSPGQTSCSFATAGSYVADYGATGQMTCTSPALRHLSPGQTRGLGRGLP